jgi:regulatory protein
MDEGFPAQKFKARRKEGLARSSEQGRAGEHPKSVTKKFMERKPKKVDAAYLHRAALYYLQRFAATRARLADVLLRKVTRRLNLKSTAMDEVQAWKPEIEKLLNRYEESGLLNDAALADARVAAMRRSGGSARNITQKMKLKGFANETITTALTHHDEAEEMSDEDAIKSFMKKKKLGAFRAATKTADDKQIKKEISALLRAGFAYQLVKRMMDTDDIMPPE